MSQLNKDTLAALDRILLIHSTSEGHIRPHAVLTGPSGSGKTFNMMKLAEKYDMPLIEINAAQLTKEGMSGQSLSKALAPLMTMGGAPCVVLVDEFDKLFISGNSNESHAHDVTTGVQNEFLKVLECETATVYSDYGKYVQAPVDNALFIFMGAFNGQANVDVEKLREFGIKTEFLGRVGLTYCLEKAPLEEFFKMVDDSELIETYGRLMPNADTVQARSAIKAVIAENYEHNTLGARLINTLTHQYFITGTLTKKEAKKAVFAKTLEFNK